MNQQTESYARALDSARRSLGMAGWQLVLLTAMQAIVVAPRRGWLTTLERLTGTLTLELAAVDGLDRAQVETVSGFAIVKPDGESRFYTGGQRVPAGQGLIESFTLSGFNDTAEYRAA
jgi:hypothetical protein